MGGGRFLHNKSWFRRKVLTKRFFFLRFHSIANIEKKIGIALELTADLPDKEVLERWLGEPIRCAILPTTLFLTNKKGYPVLSKAHQAFVKCLYKLHVQFIISGPIRHSHIKLYQQYLDHILRVIIFLVFGEFLTWLNYCTLQMYG